MKILLSILIVLYLCIPIIAQEELMVYPDSVYRRGNIILYITKHRNKNITELSANLGNCNDMSYMKITTQRTVGRTVSYITPKHPKKIQATKEDKMFIVLEYVCNFSVVGKNYEK